MCRSMADIRSTAAEIRRGKKRRRRRRRRRRKKLQDENIYGLPITYGDHKKLQGKNIMTPLLHRAAIKRRAVGVKERGSYGW